MLAYYPNFFLALWFRCSVKESLRAVDLSYDELLKEAETVTIHQRYLQILAAEIRKVKKNFRLK